MKHVTRRRVLLVCALVLAVLCVRFVTSLDARLVARAPSHLLLDRAGRYLAEVPGSQEAWGFWPLPDVLPEKVVVTTLETEDRYFYEHDGVHLPSIARAAWQNVEGGRVVSGASTIAMQVARLQHPKSRTLWRKAREAVEALLLVRRHGQDQVLRQYLTLAPYGNRCHGVERAARLYFDKPPQDLSWLQAAYLAALPQQPGRMSPWTAAGHTLALKRARRILQQLNARGVISADELRRRSSPTCASSRRPRRHPAAMHAVLALSPRRQGSAQVVHHDDARSRRPAHRPSGAGATTCAAGAERARATPPAVVVDLAERRRAGVRRQRRLLRHRGARRHRLPVDASARPAAALKPFIYALALEHGTHTAASELADTPVEFSVAKGGRLGTGEHQPQLPRADAAARGAGQLAQHPGAAGAVGRRRGAAPSPARARGGVKGMRYDPGRYGLGLAIGGLPSRRRSSPRCTWRSRTAARPIPLRRCRRRPRSAPRRRVLSTDAALLTAHILSDPKARRPGFPAGGPLDFDYAVAVKTGTSQGYRDAWASGVQRPPAGRGLGRQPRLAAHEPGIGRHRGRARRAPHPRRGDAQARARTRRSRWNSRCPERPGRARGLRAVGPAAGAPLHAHQDRVLHRRHRADANRARST